MERDSNNFQNSYQRDFDANDIYSDPRFNPMTQYEQAYTYYKYLCMQMDYKIKCKEYEKLCLERSNSVNHPNMSQGRSA